MVTTVADKAQKKHVKSRRSSDGPTTKERILTAAEHVVLRDGVARLTLESTATQAGLSKGGILYHYPTRDALVTAMVERIIVAFDADIAAGMSDLHAPGRFTLAYLRATLDVAAAPSETHHERAAAAVIAAAASEPALLAPLQAAFERWQRAIEDDGLDPTLATLVRLAADGYWLCDLFGLGTPATDRRLALLAALEQLIEGAR